MEFHEYCELFPLRQQTVDELAENMEAYGWAVFSAIIMFEDKVLDGRQRYLAAEKAGVEPVYADFTGTKAEALRFAIQGNLLRRHLSPEERKDVLRKMRDEGFWPKADPQDNLRQSTEAPDGVSGPTQQEIAETLGVGKRTVQRWDAELDAEREGRTSIRTETSGNDEWYTPEKYINLVRDVMGDIDLDPASCEFSQKVILATKFYTQDDDGLEQPWKGRVWLNPPYSKGLMDKFIAKICDEYQLGGVTQAIVLTSNFTDTEWFHKLVGIASAICLTRGRIRFYTEEGKGNSPTNGHAFFYFGQDPDRFAEVFEPVGCIVHRR